MDLATVWGSTTQLRWVISECYGSESRVQQLWISDDGEQEWRDLPRYVERCSGMNMRPEISPEGT